MRQFSKIKYSAASKTADIGAGLVWDDVYEALMPHNVSVLGGRVSGVGVAGFLLGGGLLHADVILLTLTFSLSRIFI
jgi:hypothetical protein